MDWGIQVAVFILNLAVLYPVVYRLYSLKHSMDALPYLTGDIIFM